MASWRETSLLLKHPLPTSAKTQKQKQDILDGSYRLVARPFSFGPLIGGKLADSSIVSWFHYDTPFWCAAILTAIGFCLVLALFRETHTPDPDLKVSLKTWGQSFTEGFKLKKLRIIFSANLFVFIAMFFFFNFFSAYLVNRFGFGFSLLGEINAYLSSPSSLPPSSLDSLPSGGPRASRCCSALYASASAT